MHKCRYLTAKAADIYQQMDNYTVANARMYSTQSKEAVTSSPRHAADTWFLILSPYMSCGLSPSREATVLRKHHTQQLTFLSSSAMPRKCHQSPFLWPPTIKALDLVYIGAANPRVRRCILIQLAQFRGQTRREGLSGFITFEHRLIGCYYCLHVYER